MATLEFVSPKKIKPTLRKTLQDKLYYAHKGLKNIEFADDESTRKPLIKVEYEGKISPNHLQDKIVELIKKFTRGFMEVEKEILHDKRERIPLNQEEIYPALKKKGWVHEYETGRVALAGPAMRLYDFFDDQFLKIAAAMEAEPIRFPVLISVDTLKTADYFASFPHHITLATHLVEDADKIQASAEKFAQDQDPCHFSEIEEATEHICSPAVCFHLYQLLSGKKVDQIIRRTAISNCFRYESGNMNTLERLWDFNMREIIFVGESDKVDQLRRDAMEPVMELVDNLKLKSHIETASDPFFVNNYAGQTFYQLSHRTKYELLLNIPSRGEEGTAAASFNWHQNFFGSKFKITTSKGQEAGTACTAFGIERWVYAFLSQYGLEKANWPQYLTENW
ncbi:MAG: hypothetical protein ACQES9_02415 [Myxococcota bacterium]